MRIVAFGICLSFIPEKPNTHREEGPVNMEAEIGVTLPQAKELCSSQKLEEVNMADTLISDLSLQL